MAKSANLKMRLLFVMEYLQKNSCEDEPVTTAELIEMLREKGIEAERKTIYNDISVLTEFGMDLVKTSVPKRGWFLASREFEDAEIYLLADAVGNADFITPKKTVQLTDKLYSMIGSGRKSLMRKQGITSLRKCDNESIYYHIDLISTAIAKNKQVEIVYLHRTLSDRSILISSKAFLVSPYALVWTDDHYYLIGNNSKYDNFTHLRVDKIKSVRITETSCRALNEFSDLDGSFDVAQYMQRSFHMFSGEKSEIELRCRAELLEQVIDRFTDRIYIRDSGDGWFSFRCSAYLSEGLIGWILQFGGGIEALKPETLRNDIAERVQRMNLCYNS